VLGDYGGKDLRKRKAESVPVLTNVKGDIIQTVIASRTNPFFSGGGTDEFGTHSM